MMDEKSLNEFLEKFYDNRNTDEEHQLFIDWLKKAPAQQVEEIMERYLLIFEARTDNAGMQHPKLVKEIEMKLDLLNEHNSQTESSLKLWPIYKKIASVAAVFLVATAFIIFFAVTLDFKHTGDVKKVVKLSKQELIPVGNRAILSLANGSRIILDNAKNGLLATQSGASIRKAGEGHVIYSSSPFKGFNTAYNTIVTPRGGQYKITLPDGTKVWLNAASSLKFPASFTDRERKVELKGEAYFEVAKFNSPDGVPSRFKVISGNHIVEVLGTHFNIKGYPDETAVTTTLLEGSVKVIQYATDNFKVLKPGQQAKIGNNIQVIDVDPMQSIAWKNGYFDFSNESIEDVMRNITRWYDVDVIYEKNISREKFIGSISRYKNVTDVLKMLELTGAVHFKMQGRRIIVMP